ncbi:MAG: polysaccharide biosynthesis C-terminal domain-containing protein, partial [Blautia sp.]|nr:polysaccharide biosynthesis C-terminal domain-containing protein [Blautia sp.]
MMKNLFSDRVFYKKLVGLTLPISFQALMLAAVVAADAIMLGSLSQDSMAAVSLATQIQFVQNMCLSAIAGTGSILGAQYWGKGDKKTIQDIFWIMLRLCGLLSIVCFAGCVFAPGMLMKVFTNEKELISIGSSYLRLAGFSYLLTGISQCYLTIMKVTEKAGRSAAISTGAVLLNIGLNAIFIYGLFGAPAMGARGAALATLIARVAELLASVASSYQKGFLHPPISRMFYRSALLA